MAAVIRRVLIANRGEIAIRIARTARTLGIVPLGIASEADAEALHRSAMDESLIIGPARANESYLDIARVVAAAKTLRADAVHPGYGFLSERADFAQAVLDAGLIYIGPSPATLAAAGDKRSARLLAQSLDIPTLAGYDGEEADDAALAVQAERLGFPILIKAVNGGGGRGQRAVFTAAEFPRALEEARREALAAFGDDGVLLERFIEHPRHIEFQILGDAHGNAVHFGERDCSLQRRRQKVLEEAPASHLDDALRARMAQAAITLAKATKYCGAGTVEFLVDAQDRFAFLEINARLQVEHPVTELVYGVDLVALQFHVAAGGAVPAQSEKPQGYAIEARICAEDPEHELLPSCGTLSHVRFPIDAAIRVDAGVQTGSVVPIDYDSLLAKLCVHAVTREEAYALLDSALARTFMRGIATNLPTLRAIVADETVRIGRVYTTYLDESGLLAPERSRALAAPAFLVSAVQRLLASNAHARVASVHVPLFFTIAQTPHAVDATRTDTAWHCSPLSLPGMPSSAFLPFTIALQAQAQPIDPDLAPVAVSPLRWRDANVRKHRSSQATSAQVVAPMPGRVLRIEAKPGETVEEHDVVAILEAMKMEHRIEAGLGGTVRAVLVAEGETVSAGALLMEIGKAE